MFRFSSLLLAGVLVLLSLSLSGCGGKAYEDRLEFTKEYYDYIDRINRSLGGPFNGQGVSLRPPIQFQQVASKPTRRRGASASEGNEGSEPQDDGRDARLPAHINFPLPGVVNVWQAKLETPDSGRADAYIYVLSNYSEWQTFKTPRQVADPVTFYDRIRDAFVLGLPVQINERARATETDRANKWYTETVPAAKDERFVPRREFTAISLQPEIAQGESGREYQVYLYANGDMKTALVFDVPRNVSMGENLHDRILMSLQTFEVSSEKPRAIGARSAAAGAGAGSPTEEQKPAGSGASF